MQLNRIVIISISILIGVCLAVVILLIIQNQNLTELIHYESIPQVGEKAYLFKKTDLNGNIIQLQGKKVLLIFFNTRCGACLENVQNWQQLFDANKSFHKIDIIWICEDTEKKTQQFIDQQQITFSVIADPRFELSWKYRIKMLPTLILIDKQGKIQFYQVPGQSPEEALEEVTKIMHDLFASLAGSYQES